MARADDYPHELLEGAGRTGAEVRPGYSSEYAATGPAF